MLLAALEKSKCTAEKLFVAPSLYTNDSWETKGVRGPSFSFTNTLSCRSAGGQRLGHFRPLQVSSVPAPTLTCTWWSQRSAHGVDTHPGKGEERGESCLPSAFLMSFAVLSLSPVARESIIKLIFSSKVLRILVFVFLGYTY